MGASSGMRPAVTTERALDQLKQALAPSGLDLVQPFAVGIYNREIKAPLQPLDDLGHEDHLGVLIGNTAALWEPFCMALRAEPRLMKAPHPLEQFVEQRISSAVEGLGLRYDVRFAHELGSRLVGMQRLAVLSGLAWLSPTRLCVHPVHGPWISLRAVVVLPLPSPPPAAPCPAPCDCAQGCLPLYLQAQAGAGQPDSWRGFLACRQACPAGQGARFCDEQANYHYSSTERAAWLKSLRGG